MIESKRKVLQSLLFFPGEKIYTDINTDTKKAYIIVCDKSAVKLLLNTIQTTSIIAISLLVYLGFPIYVFITRFKFELPICSIH